MKILNMKNFDYVCPHGNLIDEYALFANIISKTDKTITFERYMNFGKIKCPNPITSSIEDFNKYYVKYEDLWKHIGKTPLLFKIIKHWRQKMEKHTNRAKKIKTKAHRWQVDSDGGIDFFAMSQNFCNGPLCMDCYASFCVHCLEKNKGENAIYQKLTEQKCKEKIICSSCFKIVSSDDNYCKNCGAKFDE